MLLCCLRRTLQPSATGTSSFRSDASTSGSAVSPAACMILCVRFVWVVRRYVYPSQSRNTRYGWVANPYPTGTFTLKDTPSLSRRGNVAFSGPQSVAPFCVIMERSGIHKKALRFVGPPEMHCYAYFLSSAFV